MQASEAFAIRDQDTMCRQLSAVTVGAAAVKTMHDMSLQAFCRQRRWPIMK